MHRQKKRCEGTVATPFPLAVPEAGLDSGSDHELQRMLLKPTGGLPGQERARTGQGQGKGVPRKGWDEGQRAGVGQRLYGMRAEQAGIQ